jgi:hypothetical protein
MIRSFGLMNRSHMLIQYLNVACRVARSFPELPISRLLLSLNDDDAKAHHPLSKERRQKLVYRIVEPLVLMILSIFNLLPYRVGETVCEELLTVVLCVLAIVLMYLGMFSLSFALIVVAGIVAIPIIILVSLRLSSSLSSPGRNQVAPDLELRIEDEEEFMHIKGTLESKPVTISAKDIHFTSSYDENKEVDELSERQESVLGLLSKQNSTDRLPGGSITIFDPNLYTQHRIRSRISMSANTSVTSRDHTSPLKEMMGVATIAEDNSTIATFNKDYKQDGKDLELPFFPDEMPYEPDANTIANESQITGMPFKTQKQRHRMIRNHLLLKEKKTLQRFLHQQLQIKRANNNQLSQGSHDSNALNQSYLNGNFNGLFPVPLSSPSFLAGSISPDPLQLPGTGSHIFSRGYSPLQPLQRLEQLYNKDVSNAVLYSKKEPGNILKYQSLPNISEQRSSSPSRKQQLLPDQSNGMSYAHNDAAKHILSHLNDYLVENTIISALPFANPSNFDPNFNNGTSKLGSKLPSKLAPISGVGEEIRGPNGEVLELDGSTGNPAVLGGGIGFAGPLATSNNLMKVGGSHIELLSKEIAATDYFHLFAQRKDGFLIPFSDLTFEQQELYHIKMQLFQQDEFALQKPSFLQIGEEDDGNSVSGGQVLLTPMTVDPLHLNPQNYRRKKNRINNYKHVYQYQVDCASFEL